MFTSRKNLQEIYSHENVYKLSHKYFKTSFFSSISLYNPQLTFIYPHQTRLVDRINSPLLFLFFRKDKINDNKNYCYIMNKFLIFCKKIYMSLGPMNSKVS